MGGLKLKKFNSIERGKTEIKYREISWQFVKGAKYYINKINVIVVRKF